MDLPKDPVGDEVPTSDEEEPAAGATFDMYDPTTRRMHTEQGTNRRRTQQALRQKDEKAMAYEFYGSPNGIATNNPSDLNASHIKTRPCTSNTQYFGAKHNAKSISTNPKSKRYIEQESEIELNQSPRLKNFQSHSNLYYGNPTANQTLEHFRKEERGTQMQRAMSGAVAKPQTGFLSNPSRHRGSEKENIMKQNLDERGYMTNPVFHNPGENSATNRPSLKNNRRIVS